MLVLWATHNLRFYLSWNLRNTIFLKHFVSVKLSVFLWGRKKSLGMTEMKPQVMAFTPDPGWSTDGGLWC